jgi:MinD-like ATPase involved in chromosome partitioning or flagellar assembly/DNA-binding MarR family transcriptional regulator
MAKILSIHSFRHGTGKSNLTANLAVLLAQQGQRVGIIETDRGAPGIHALFGLDDQAVDTLITDFLQSNRPIEEATSDLSGMIPVGAGAVAVLSSRTALSPTGVKVGEIAKLLQDGYDLGLLGSQFHQLVIRLNLDYLLVDTSPGFTEVTLLAMTLSDLVLLVMCLDQQDFQGTAVAVDIARKLNVPAKLVVNQVLPIFNLQEIPKQLEEIYQVPVVGMIPFAEEMLLLAGNDIFCRRYPNHRLTLAVRNMLEQIRLDQLLQTIPSLRNSPTSQESTAADSLDDLSLQQLSKQGLSMSTVLLLPAAERRLINWLLRHPSGASLAEMAEELTQDPQQLSDHLEHLVERGLIQKEPSEDGVRYRARLVPKPSQRPFSPMWQQLETDE